MPDIELFEILQAGKLLQPGVADGCPVQVQVRQGLEAGNDLEPGVRHLCSFKMQVLDRLHPFQVLQPRVADAGPSEMYAIHSGKLRKRRKMFVFGVFADQVKVDLDPIVIRCNLSDGSAGFLDRLCRLVVGLIG